MSSRGSEAPTPKPGDSRAEVETITTYITPKKQAAKRHYGTHQYFTKRAWNVIQAYIERFTRPGDVVCDPYGGSGTTIVEAMVLGRRGIYLDISDWSRFLARQTGVAPVDISSLAAAFELVESKCAKKLSRWSAMPTAEVNATPITRWYPQDYPLPRNSDVPRVQGLFTHRQLLCLSELNYQVNRVPDEQSRDLLRVAFSATLYMCNRTFISAKNRKESRGGSSIFSIYRYKVAKTTVELDPWTIFAGRVKRLITAKLETNQLIGSRPPEIRDAQFLRGYAQDLSDQVAPESVDYIFTDPPYGAHISYLDLTTMWNAWMGFEVSERDRMEEAIEGGDQRHSSDHFKAKLADGIAEMFKVLKYDRWMSIVFAHREPAIWDSIVKAAEGAGFEYVNTVAQPLSVVWSMHKKKNPLTVLSGELILNFRKVRNPRTLAISSVGIDALNLIKNSAELSIVAQDGASTERIYSDLIPKLLENGMLGEVSSKIGDISPILRDEFAYNGETGTWHIKPGQKLGHHIRLEDRIRFYVVDYLNQCERLGRSATIDEIIMHVLPKLKNGHQPDQQLILDELRKVARPHKGKYWIRWENPQTSFEFAADPVDAILHPPEIAKPLGDYEHNEVIWNLATLARGAGLTTHIGVREQSATWRGVLMSSLSVKSLTFTRGAEAYTKQRIAQIDLLWLDAKRPEFAFEVEHSTPITTGIDRFIELLKVAPNMAEKLVIIAPKARRKKLDQVLSSSHYIGAPMYMEAKIRYLWYSDVAEIIHRFSRQQPSKAKLVAALTEALHHPRVERDRARS